jgi:hypothetical protein
MSSATIPIQLPEFLFQRLKRAAELTHRSVEEIAATTLDAALPSHPNLPAEIANELAAMQVFSDDALWAAVEPSFSPTQARRLAQLNATTSERELSVAESSEQRDLIAAYRHSVLRRAQALAILAQRGHPLPNLAHADNGEN